MVWNGILCDVCFAMLNDIMFVIYVRRAMYVVYGVCVMYVIYVMNGMHGQYGMYVMYVIVCM